MNDNNKQDDILNVNDAADSKSALWSSFMSSDVIIFHGEAECILPYLMPVDLLLTDPPYGIGEANGKNKSRGCLAVSQDYGVQTWDNKPCPMWLIDMARLRADMAIIWGGHYYTMPPTSCLLIWDKDNGETDFADCETAWTNLKKATRIKKYKWQGMLQENMKNKEKRVHPTQKPLKVMKWAITQAPDDCHVILDPFMGSGTTLIAAKELGRKAIGIEREEKYCKIAVERLRQEVLFSQGIQQLVRPRTGSNGRLENGRGLYLQRMRRTKRLGYFQR